MTATDLERDSLYIKSIIESNSTFFIGRIAGVELKVAYKVLNNLHTNPADELAELENNAGIRASTQESLTNYVNQLISSYKSCTTIAEWPQDGKVFSLTGQGQTLISELTPTTPKISALALEPYYFNEAVSWMPALNGKRILIIHPFAKTLEKQVPNFDKLFPGRTWFKDCEFQFIQPPLTLAGNHVDRDWESHYTAFISSPAFRELKDFDIALIAAGGYGMLIANHIYISLNRSVIYIGGALQIFFGVIGKRWFTNRDILNLTNDDWIRPGKEDKPPNFSKVERGCYW
jgi:hypothetical protein